MVPYLVTLTDLSTHCTGLSASAELLVSLASFVAQLSHPCCPNGFLPKHLLPNWVSPKCPHATIHISSHSVTIQRVQQVHWSHQYNNTIQYNTNSISGAPPTPTADRGQITYSVQFTVQFWCSAENKNVFSLCLNSGVECKYITSIDNESRWWH